MYTTEIEVVFQAKVYHLYVYYIYIYIYLCVCIRMCVFICMCMFVSIWSFMGVDARGKRPRGSVGRGRVA